MSADIIKFPRSRAPAHTRFAERLERLVSIIADHARVDGPDGRKLTPEEVEETRRRLLTKILEARAELHGGR